MQIHCEKNFNLPKVYIRIVIQNFYVLRFKCGLVTLSLDQVTSYAGFHCLGQTRDGD